MGKEYTGVLLIMAAIFHCSLGRRLLQTKPKVFGDPEQGEDWYLGDWTMLVESFLEWESWLKSTTYPRNLVVKAKRKHRVLMYLLKKVAKRSEGMQFKVMKFHGVVHMADDMLNFGTAMELDVGSNESGHKPTKHAAKLTQRNEETFVQQTDERLSEFLVIDMAIAELSGRFVWDYYAPYREVPKIPKPDVITTGGAHIKVFYSEKLQWNTFKFGKKLKSREHATVEESALDFLVELQDIITDKVKTAHELVIRTEHKQNGTVFQAHPHYKGGTWHDWVMIDWGDYGILPGHIWFFVDLRCIPEDTDLGEFGGISLNHGVYAMIESAEFVEDEQEISKSKIFVPIRKEVGRDEENDVFVRQFYLADVDSFESPVAVIPDIGGRPNDYFIVKNREEWQDLFEV